MKTYTQQDYENDKRYIKAHDDAGTNIGDLGKLEILTLGYGSRNLYIDHSGLLSKFLGIQTVQRLLEYNVVLDNMIKKRHKIAEPKVEMRDEELKQVREECLAIIHKRVGELFDQRSNGARRRVNLYERRLQDPKYQLKELEAALQEKDQDRIYELSERFAIMTEHLDDKHRLVKAYAKLCATKLNDN